MKNTIVWCSKLYIVAIMSAFVYFKDILAKLFKNNRFLEGYII